VSGLSAFLGELHEGLPRLIGSATLFKERAFSIKTIKGIGEEHLNVQFGILPFISDVQKFAYAFKNAAKLLKQYRRDSGRIVRRGILPDDRLYTSTKVVNVNGSQFHSTPDGLDPDFTGSEWLSMTDRGIVAVKLSRTLLEQFKFTGAYSYLVSEDDSFLGRVESYAQQANKLLGTNISLDVIWELTPWSWLADWETNIGTNITNLVALGQDNLVLRWGYLQRHTTCVDTMTMPANYFGSHPSLDWFNAYSRKERVKATPFGFGLNTAGFTDRQWAILGALGVTHAPKTLPQ
jgi:hypothetical protein